MAGQVRVGRDGGIVTVTLDTPRKLNALSESMWTALARPSCEASGAVSRTLIH
jgi:enoyl-CoA hydratase/carnithine racemase